MIQRISEKTEDKLQAFFFRSTGQLHDTIFVELTPPNLSLVRGLENAKPSSDLLEKQMP